MKEKLFKQMFLASLRATGKKRDLKDLQFHICQCLELDMRQAFLLIEDLHNAGRIEWGKGRKRWWVWAPRIDRASARSVQALPRAAR